MGNLIQRGAGLLIIAIALALGVATTPLAVAADEPQRYARVIKPYGAALRAEPHSEAPIMFHAFCGDVLPVTGEHTGWVRVRAGLGDEGWVGGARVAVGETVPEPDCAGRIDFWTGMEVSTFVPSGCLSLRSAPSREAPVLQCVANGHHYLLTDGPLDPGTGEDWFRVTSPSTGAGWVLADPLIPS